MAALRSCISPSVIRESSLYTIYCILIEILDTVLGYHLVMYIAVSVVRLCHLRVSFSMIQKYYMNIYESPELSFFIYVQMGFL